VTRYRALAPVWMWTRADLGRRIRSLAVLALLAALGAGTVMTAVAGARRGGSAVGRLSVATDAATVVVRPTALGLDWDAVRRIPGVAAVGTVLEVDFQIDVPTPPVARKSAWWVDTWYPVGDSDMTRTVERPAVVTGRLADATRVDEAVVTEQFAGAHRVGVGDTVTARMYTPAEADTWFHDNVSGPRTGPRQPLRIVGVVRSPAFIEDTSPRVIITSAAFTARYRSFLLGAHDTGYDTGYVRLTDGEAGLPAFEKAVKALDGRGDVSFVDRVSTGRAAVRAARFERNALLGFGLAALLTTAVVVGQAAGRIATAGAVDLRALRPAGLSYRQAAACAAVGPGIAAGVGVAVAAVAAVAASAFFPIGTAARYEPDPGIRPDPLVIAAVGAATLALVLAAALTAARRTRLDPRPDRAPRRSAVAAAALRLTPSIPLVFGTRFALEPGRGPAAVPVRPALVGTTLGVLGVLGALTFHAGVVGATADPSRFGRTYQIAGWTGQDGVDFVPAARLQMAYAADPDVVGVNDTRYGVAAVGGRSLDVYSDDPVGGKALPAAVLTGRMPALPGEIALAPATAKKLGASIGERLTVTGSGPAGVSATLTVTGIAFSPGQNDDGFDTGSWIVAGDYHRLFPDGLFSYHLFLVAVRPGASAQGVLDRVATTLTRAGLTSNAGLMTEPRRAEEMRNIQAIPFALCAFLAVLALGATGHALAATARRRRDELAVLRALGTTRGQIRRVILTQATIIAAIGLALGGPLGVALGRVVWRSVAAAAPVRYVAPVAPLAIALVIPVTLTLAALLAVGVGWRAARTQVADILRAEQ